MIDNDASTSSFDLHRFVWRRKFLIAIVAAAAALAGMLATLVGGPAYTATAEILVRDLGLEESAFPQSTLPPADQARDTETSAELLMSDEVASGARTLLPAGLSDVEDLSERVVAESAGASDLITVSVSDSDPEDAAELTNAVVSSFIKLRRDDTNARFDAADFSVRAELEALSPQERSGAAGNALRQQLVRLNALRSLQVGDARVLRPADVPELTPRFSVVSLLVNGFIGGILGLLAGVGLALLLDRLDSRLRDGRSLAAAADLPLLASIPRYPETPTVGTVEPLPPDVLESFRLLRSRLRYFNVGSELRSVLVSSPGIGDGKSTVALQLALAAATAGSRVLVVEADLRRPVLALRSGAEAVPGLAEALSGQAESGAVRRVVVEHPGGGSVSLIPAGAVPPNPIQLLDGPEVRELIVGARDEYDLVVVDTPSVNTVADALPLVGVVDGVLVVGRVGFTSTEAVSELIGQLQGLDAHLLGAVAVGAQDAPPASY